TRMRSLAIKTLLIGEVVVCFATPTWMWLMGVVFMVPALAGPDPEPMFAMFVVCGVLGLFALFGLLRFLLAEAPEPLRWSLVVTQVIAGLAAIWTIAVIWMVDGYEPLKLIWSLFYFAGLPTLASAHLLWLAAQKSRAL